LAGGEDVAPVCLLYWEEHPFRQHPASKTIIKSSLVTYCAQQSAVILTFFNMEKVGKEMDVKNG
jgi:hypothetical protein